MCTCRARVKECSSQASASQRNMNSRRERLELFSFELLCVSCMGQLRFVAANPGCSHPLGLLESSGWAKPTWDCWGLLPCPGCQLHLFTCGALSLAAAFSCPRPELFLLEILLDIIPNAVTPPGVSVRHQKWLSSCCWAHLQHDEHWNSTSDVLIGMQRSSFYRNSRRLPIQKEILSSWCTRRKF